VFKAAWFLISGLRKMSLLSSTVPDRHVPMGYGSLLLKHWASHDKTLLFTQRNSGTLSSAAVSHRWSPNNRRAQLEVTTACI